MVAPALRRVDDIVEFVTDVRQSAASARGLAINICWLRKSFGPNEVLRGLNLHIRSGQFVAVVGRSGCGKSTLLRLLLGLDRASGGEFWFGEEARAKPDSNAIRIMPGRNWPTAVS